MLVLAYPSDRVLIEEVDLERDLMRFVVSKFRMVPGVET